MGKFFNELGLFLFFGWLIGIAIWVTYDAGVEAARGRFSPPPEKEKWQLILLFGGIGSAFVLMLLQARVCE